MSRTPAIVRFRGRVGFAAHRLAVVEFPPSLRTVLVASAYPYRCQMPYHVFVIFYDRSDGGIALANTHGDLRSTHYSGVCLYFRNSPMTSIDSPLCRTPLPNQVIAIGATCFGDDPTMRARLYAKHATLRGLVQTVTESFWGTSFYPNQLQPGCRVGSRRVYTFADWARESKNPDFLGTVDWEKKAGLPVQDLIETKIKGRFNPGRRPT